MDHQYYQAIRISLASPEQIRSELVLRKQNAALDEYVATLEEEILVVRKELPSLAEIAGLGEGP